MKEEKKKEDAREKESFTPFPIKSTPNTFSIITIIFFDINQAVSYS